MSPGESLRTPLSRNPRVADPADIAARRVGRAPAALGEWVVMKWAAVVVLGVGLELAVVIVMARSNTARWERDHRAARAALRAREEAGLRVRAAAVVAQRVPPGARWLPHPHLTQLPHVHLPQRVVDRLAHPRGTLHRPHLHLPHLRLIRRRPDVHEEPVPAQEEPVPAQEARVPAQRTPAPAPDEVSPPSEEQPAS